LNTLFQLFISRQNKYITFGKNNKMNLTFFVLTFRI